MTANNATILLLDDDHDFVEMNQRVLEAAGYAVVCCYDAAEALAKLAGGGVDLVVSDLMMKSLDAGFQFVQQLRESPATKGLPVIMATSVSSQMGLDFTPRTAADLAAMRIDAFFDKPVPPGRLLEKVAELLGRAH